MTSNTNGRAGAFGAAWSVFQGRGDLPSHGRMIVVADRSRALFLAGTASGRQLRLLRELNCALGRAHGSDITVDRPGRNRNAMCSGSVSATSRHTPPCEVEAQKFSRQIVEALEKQMQQDTFAHWAIFAPPHLLGMVRGLLGPGLQRRLTLAAHKEIAHLELPELKRYIAHALQRLPAA